MDIDKAITIAGLKSGGYRPRTVKQELRENLIRSLEDGQNVFESILGYEETVIPDLERAILAGHNINLLGLRGQAKTSIARMMVNLLDEYVPAIAGSELNDDPFHPVSHHAKTLVAELGDDTPVRWIHRSERYTEKLATPDVTVADLIGDIDPIKAANLKLSYSDERVLHYGLVPHANRGIFVINELPDLQPRIQVALFNILQEGDIQIRGFKVRLPLDIQFVFTANPEDYTNRGAIITPLKDRIQSQIITHYPRSIDIARQITLQQADVTEERSEKVQVMPMLHDLLEEIAFVARESEFVDQKSGVSARLTISAYEALIAAAERRIIRSGEKNTVARISDLMGVIPAITGKVELVYEGEQEGAMEVAHALTRQAIRKEFVKRFPNPEKLQRKEGRSPYQEVIDWFASHELDLDHNLSNSEYMRVLGSVKPLRKLVRTYAGDLRQEEEMLWAEFVLHALAEFSLIGKRGYYERFNFNDMLGSMLK